MTSRALEGRGSSTSTKSMSVQNGGLDGVCLDMPPSVAGQPRGGRGSILGRLPETNIPEGFTVFSIPEAHRKKTRTSNACETLNSQIKRRTRVVGLFPNEDSLLRLVTAVLIEISETWETGKVYLKLS